MLYVGKILKNPVTIFVGIAAGIVLGLYFPSTVPYVTPISNSYIQLLLMSLLPMIFASIVYGLASLLRNPKLRKKLFRIIMIFIIAMLLASFFGYFSAMICKHGLHLQYNAQANLGKVIKHIELYPAVKTATANTTHTPAVASLLKHLVPGNIFSELNRGISIRLIVIALLIGIALGELKYKASDVTLSIVKTIRIAFYNIFNWLIYLLPIGICCIFASTIATIDYTLLYAISKLIIMVLIFTVVILLICNAVIAISFKQSFFSTLKSFKKTLLITLMVGNAFVAMPFAFDELDKLKVDKNLVDFTLPLALSMSRLGKIFIFSTLTMFIAYIYNMPLSPYDITIILLFSIISGATAPGKSIALYPALCIVLKVAGLPIDLGLVLLSITYPIFARVTDIITIYGNIACISVIAKSI